MDLINCGQVINLSELCFKLKNYQQYILYGTIMYVVPFDLLIYFN